MRQSITQSERDFCEEMNDYYTGELFKKLTDGRITDTRYSKCYVKLGEWEEQLEFILVSEVSDHK